MDPLLVKHAVAAPSAGELAADVRAGRTDPLTLVEQALTRLEACDVDVHAFVHVDASAALAVARNPPDGPLRGVPVAVKDLFDVAGQITRAGSLVPAGPAATEDGAAVARLRAAGAVVLGRTRTHEYAWGLTTQHLELGGTRNPWDTGRVPGGSSGGSAAAVAAGIVPLALGTDTGASIRLPAAWCGLVGHKPTFGAVPLAGCTPLAPSLDHGGALVRTVADARLWLSVLGDVRLEARAPVAGLLAGVARALDTTPDVGVLFEQAVERASSCGIGVRDVALPPADRLVEVYLGVQAGEALAWHRASGRWPAHADAYGPDVRSFLEAADRADPDRLAAAQSLREQLRARITDLFGDVDVLFLPVAGCGPPTTAAPTRSALGPLRDAVLPLTVLANLCGLPACAVPVGVDIDGLPVGLQVLGPPGADSRVLDVAERLQVQLPWG